MNKHALLFYFGIGLLVVSVLGAIIGVPAMMDDAANQEAENVKQQLRLKADELAHDPVVRKHIDHALDRAAAMDDVEKLYQGVEERVADRGGEEWETKEQLASYYADLIVETRAAYKVANDYFETARTVQLNPLSNVLNDIRMEQSYQFREVNKQTVLAWKTAFNADLDYALEPVNIHVWTPLGTVAAKLSAADYRESVEKFMAEERKEKVDQKELLKKVAGVLLESMSKKK